MAWNTIKARPAEVVFGHCEFCDHGIGVRIHATGNVLTPFGECAACRRFTIWDEVELDDLGFPPQRLAS
jgi:hypothetical protein